MTPKTKDSCSEENELLSHVALDSFDVELKHVELDSLGECSALADSHDISFLDSWECWGTVSGKVLVSLLESVVLLDVMEVVPSDDDGSLHLG